MNTKHKTENQIPRAAYTGSFGSYQDLPAVKGLEFCVLGRSNVGKSSFINRVFGDNALAKVSKKPGKTVCANIYQLDNGMRFVDLPGYGYAKTAVTESMRIVRLIREYCEQRTGLTGVIWLLDIRHVGTDADNDAFNWLRALNRPILPVLTKADKLGRSEQNRQCGEFSRHFTFAVPPLPFSAERGESRERFWTAFKSWAGTLRSSQQLLTGC